MFAPKTRRIFHTHIHMKRPHYSTDEIRRKARRALKDVKNMAIILDDGDALENDDYSDISIAALAGKVATLAHWAGRLQASKQHTTSTTITT